MGKQMDSNTPEVRKVTAELLERPQETAKVARLEAARWKAMLEDMDGLLSDCVTSHGEMKELQTALKVSHKGNAARTQEEASQETIVKARQSRQSTLPGLRRQKTQAERKAELHGLRRELADMSTGESPMTSPRSLAAFDSPASARMSLL